MDIDNTLQKMIQAQQQSKPIGKFVKGKIEYHAPESDITRMPASDIKKLALKNMRNKVSSDFRNDLMKIQNMMNQTDDPNELKMLKELYKTRIESYNLDENQINKQDN